MGQIYDAVILGGGSAGYSCALRLRGLGKSVALIEKDKLGGTCLHRGCVPTKAFLHISEVAEEIHKSSSLGLTASVSAIDADKILSYKNNIIDGKHKGLQGLLKAKGVDIISGAGRLISNTSVEVGGEIIEGKNIVLATGSKSIILPGLALSDRILDSERALNLNKLPKSIAILGGGVIGVEFASVYNALGVDVTIIEGAPRLTPNEDPKISAYLEKIYKQKGIKLSLGVFFDSAAERPDGVDIKLQDGTELSAEYLLVAIGRGPVTDNMGFEEAGINITKGFVDTNNKLETSLKGVYAIGDIVFGLQLAHRAYVHGIFVAETIAGLKPVLTEDINIPRVTYCDPQILSIGLTEAQAKEKFGDSQVEAAEYNLSGNAKSTILGTGGFVKLVRQKNGPIVGVHGIGSRMGELIGEAQLIVGWEAYPEDIAPLIHAHPTQAESIGEAAMILAKKPLHAI